MRKLRFLRRESVFWLSVLCTSAICFWCATGQTSLGKELLAAWEFNDTDVSGDTVVATGGTAAFMGELSLVDSISIGRNKDSTEGGGQWFYDGLIDDLQIYDKAMTPREVLYLSGRGVLGDFNGNGEIDLGDIDLLTEVSAAKTHPQEYDLTNDGLVDEADVIEWAKADDIGYTWIGDANFDGQFNTGDFVQVLGIGKYEDQNAKAVWSEGDWNGDGVFGTGDLVAALSDGGYELGPRTDVSAVPEPSAIVLSLLGLVGSLGLARRRQR